MLAWILENISTIIICAVLVIIVSAVIAGLIRNKKKGKSSCGCGCSGCPMSCSCNGAKHNAKQ
ncbi:MAG: FeoB-associated Cys-rich membrane protein [Eubacterium sp.]